MCICVCVCQIYCKSRLKDLRGQDLSYKLVLLELTQPHTHTHAHAHAHTHSFNGPLSRTTRVSQYQKGKTNLDFTEARDSEWQWHQLGHMQVCTSLQTNNHASTAPHHWDDALPAAQPTASKHWMDELTEPVVVICLVASLLVQTADSCLTVSLFRLLTQWASSVTVVGSVTHWPIAVLESRLVNFYCCQFVSSDCWLLYWGYVCEGAHFVHRDWQCPCSIC